MPTLSLTLIEIIVLMLGALILGITIHFFIVSRRNLRATLLEHKKSNPQFNEWKVKYFNEIEARDKELAQLRSELNTAKENNSILSIEAEEIRRQNKKLQADVDSAAKHPRPEANDGKSNYYEQLREAQLNLAEHNDRINRLLDQLDLIRESEEKATEVLRDNEELAGQVQDLQAQLMQKEQELSQVRRTAHLSKEMTSMLDNAYSEFNALQEKMQKLEMQVTTSRTSSLELEELKEGYAKLQRDHEEQRIKLNAFAMENRELQLQLNDAEEQLREITLQRQQLQKRVGYLEELNNDLQDVSDANKRLEGQIKRIGELESMLNMVSEERDQLMRSRQG